MRLTVKLAGYRDGARMSKWAGGDDEDDDDGLPDGAFTDLELAAGVQYLARTGDPDVRLRADEQGHGVSTDDTDFEIPDDLWAETVDEPKFATFERARAWAKTNSGGTISRDADGQGYQGKQGNRSAGPGQLLAVEADNDSQARLFQISLLAPALHDALVSLQPIERGRLLYPLPMAEWAQQLIELQPAESRQLHALLTEQLEANKAKLRKRYGQMFDSLSTNAWAGNLNECIDYRRQEVAEMAMAHVEARYGVIQEQDYGYFMSPKDISADSPTEVAAAHVGPQHGVTQKRGWGFRIFSEDEGIKVNIPSLHEALISGSLIWATFEDELRQLESLPAGCCRAAVAWKLSRYRASIKMAYMAMWHDTADALDTCRAQLRRAYFEFEYGRGAKPIVRRYDARSEWYSVRRCWKRIQILERVLASIDAHIGQRRCGDTCRRSVAQA